MASNDTADMQRMQQDAIRRVREMQSRAQQTLNQSQNPAPPPEPPPRKEPERAHNSHAAAPPPPQLPPQAPIQATSLSNLFDGLMQDSERTLILVLLLILVSEKADTGLIFALMYLII